MSASSEHSKNRKDPNILKLNSTLPNYLWTKKEGSKEITKYFELDWNKSITYQKLLVNPKGNQLCTFIRRMMLKLKLQYSGHLTWRADSFEKTLMQQKTEGRRRRGQQRMRWWMGSLIQWTRVWTNSRRQWRTGKPRVLQSMGLQRIRHDWVTEQESKT